MALTALPTFYDLTDPTSNLAGDPCSDPLGELAALMGHSGLAADRLVLPPIIEENRIEWGERWALPLLIGTGMWFTQRRVVPTGLWALAAYMAPLPVAGFLAAAIGAGALITEYRGQQSRRGV